MAQKFPSEQYPGMRYSLGDVRDPDCLNRVIKQVDTVVHASALKQQPAAEYNPFDAIKINILTAQNVIEAYLNDDIKGVVALPTDKADAPSFAQTSSYRHQHNIRGWRDLRFSAVR